jgi:isopentenyl-diphosphate delta-isomerase
MACSENRDVMHEVNVEPVVELVDTSGSPLGTMDKFEAHAAPGRLHRAISVFLVDSRGRVILQQRAATKYHSPRTWANSCCSHPLPGEVPARAAARRVSDELGIRLAPGAFEPAGIVIYSALDRQTGLVEHEYDHLFVAAFSGAVHPNPHEVAATARVQVADLLLGERGRLEVAPWFETVMNAVAPALAAFRGS